MKLHELKPVPVIVKIDGGKVVFQLRPFDLDAVVWANSFYGTEEQQGLDVLNQVFATPGDWDKYSSAVATVCYYLSEGLSAFEIYTADQFTERLNNSENTRIDIIALGVGLQQVFKNSFTPHEPEPEMTGGAIFEFLKQQEQGCEKPGINWAQIYTMFFMGGGMSIDDFYKLTMKQIEALVQEIGIHKMEAFQSSALSFRIDPKKIKIPRRKQQFLN